MIWKPFPDLRGSFRSTWLAQLQPCLFCRSFLRITAPWNRVPASEKKPPVFVAKFHHGHRTEEELDSEVEDGLTVKGSHDWDGHCSMAILSTGTQTSQTQKIYSLRTERNRYIIHFLAPLPKKDRVESNPILAYSDKLNIFCILTLGFLYPLVIKRGNGKSYIYRWFSQL